MLLALQTHITHITNFLTKLKGSNFKENQFDFHLEYNSIDNYINFKIWTRNSSYEINIWNKGSRIKAEISENELHVCKASCRTKPELLLKDMKKYTPSLYTLFGWSA